MAGYLGVVDCCTEHHVLSCLHGCSSAPFTQHFVLFSWTFRAKSIRTYVLNRNLSPFIIFQAFQSTSKQHMQIMRTKAEGTRGSFRIHCTVVLLSVLLNYAAFLLSVAADNIVEQCYYVYCWIVNEMLKGFMRLNICIVTKHFCIIL